jgi:hypothetical protein
VCTCLGPQNPCIGSKWTIAFLNSVPLIAVVGCCIVALHVLVCRCVYHEVTIAMKIPPSDLSYLHLQCILLGAVPFPSDVPRLKQLGVQGVVTLNEPYETLVPMSLYQVNFALLEFLVQSHAPLFC